MMMPRQTQDPPRAGRLPGDDSEILSIPGEGAIRVVSVKSLAAWKVNEQCSRRLNQSAP